MTSRRRGKAQKRSIREVDEASLW